ncbi:MotA/TolQ/ExbB proton channel family protein [Prosthecobacter fusiformis]|nr:MotA/TolQ/ExbB proton channel family protein [Prosthecobacter fusiformis]
MKRFVILLAPWLAFAPAGAQETSPSVFNSASASAQKDYDQSLANLTRVRAEIDKDKEPMNRELAEAEAELAALQERYGPLTSELDQAELNVVNLKNQVKLATDESNYLTNIMDEFTKGYESKVHVSELQRLGEVLNKAKAASDDEKGTLKDRFMAQVGLIRSAIVRLSEVIGGTRFEGQAVDSQGFVMDGKFALIGPMAFFSSTDGKGSGIAMPQVGSPMPIIRSITPEINASIASLVETGKGLLPLDATLGGAIKDFVTKHTLLDTYKHGGPIMHPLLLVSVLVFGTALERIFFILREKKRRKPRDVHELLEAVEAGDFDKAIGLGRKSQDYVARALSHALEHVETNISDALGLAASMEIKRFKRGFFVLDTGMTIAPLLGLLGTVTGMMASFAAIGADMGAPSAITGGIAEALIATAFGLVIAMTGLVPFNYLNNMVEDAEHELEVAASKLELIIEKNKKHEEELRHRHKQMLASSEGGLQQISGPAKSGKIIGQDPLPA